MEPHTHWGKKTWLSPFLAWLNTPSPFMAWLKTPSLREWVVGTWAPMLLWLNWWCLGCACQATANRRVGKWRGKFAKIEVVATLTDMRGEEEEHQRWRCRNLRRFSVPCAQEFVVFSSFFSVFFNRAVCLNCLGEKFVEKWVPFAPLFCWGLFFPGHSLC